MNCPDQCSVLLVDDDHGILSILTETLEKNGYRVVACDKPVDALVRLSELDVDIVLTDIAMPEISGLDLLEQIRKIKPEMPVILMTAFPGIDICIDAIKKGAHDFIIKPFKSAYLFHTLENALQLVRLKKLEQNYKLQLEKTIRERTGELSNALKMVKNMNREIIRRMTIISEYKSEDTGVHISRIGLYANKLSEALDMSGDFTEAITYASSMHDIGKVGVPDNILMKPGELTKPEFEIMKLHTLYGHEILSGSDHFILQMAESIALNHHERWDGSGYPSGIEKEDIPIQARITLLCDQYDALRSPRPYKPAFDHEQTFKILTRGDGRTMPEHFAPDVLDAFIALAPVMDEIYTSFPQNDIKTAVR